MFSHIKKEKMINTYCDRCVNYRGNLLNHYDIHLKYLTILCVNKAEKWLWNFILPLAINAFFCISASNYCYSLSKCFCKSKGYKLLTHLSFILTKKVWMPFDIYFSFKCVSFDLFVDMICIEYFVSFLEMFKGSLHI